VKRVRHLPADSWLRLVVFLVFAVGLVDIWSAAKATIPERLDLLRAVVPFEYRAASRLAAGLSGFALLVLARGLARRQRNALWLSVAVLSLGTLANLLKGLELEAAAVSLAMLALLLLGRQQFVARHDRPTARMALRVLALAVFVTLLYGTLGYDALSREFHLHLSLPQALAATVSTFTFGAPPLPHTRLARFFLDSIYLLAATSLGTAVVMALRPVVERGRAGEAERRAARALVDAHGRSSLAHIALLGEKQYLFTPGGSVVAYKPVGNVGLALGDPIGPDDDAAAAVEAFARFCRERAWRPVFYQTMPDTRAHYRDVGLQTTLIGQQAVVELDTFTLSGGRNKNLRAGVNRMEREGYRMVWHDPPQSTERLHALAAVSSAWLRSRRTAEKEFSLGRFDEAYIAACPVATVEDAGGRVLAFVNLIHEYGRAGLAIDLMRFVDGAPPETMLFLFVRLLEHMREHGFARADLGLSALSGLDASPRAPLAYAALDAGLHTTWFPSYGPEMRGGAAHCTTIVSDDPIGSPVVHNPRAAVVLNLPSLERYEPLLKPGGVLVVNSSIVDERPGRTDLEVLRVPGDAIAQELGEKRVTNLVLLGALLARLNVLKLQQVRATLDHVIPEHRRHLLATNLDALERGAALARREAAPV